MTMHTEVERLTALLAHRRPASSARSAYMTLALTVLLTPEGADVDATALASIGDRALFVTREKAAQTTTLWVTDGSPGGTHPVTNGSDPIIGSFNSGNDRSRGFTASGGYVYFPAEPTEQTREDVLEHVVRTYFAGSTEQAVTALLRMSDADVSESEVGRLRDKIRHARQSGR